MNTKNLETLKIHKLTQAQYDRELAAGNIDENALYLTPDDNVISTNMMVVTGTLADEADPTFTADSYYNLTTDKTYEEVLDHVNNGGYVVFYLKESQQWYALDKYYGNEVARGLIDRFIFKNIYVDYINPNDLVRNVVSEPAICTAIILMDRDGESYYYNQANLLNYKSDWNVNDEYDPAYIKNRTHYIDFDTVTHPESTVSRESSNTILDVYGFEQGKTYNVTFNGTVYPCEFKCIDHYGYCINYLGNGSLLNSDYGVEFIDTTEPFCISCDGYYTPLNDIYVKESGNHTIKIDGIVEEFTVNCVAGESNGLYPTITAGQTYNVHWDGTDYTLQAYTGTNNTRMVYLGNGNLCNSDEPVSQGAEPFVFAAEDTGIMLLFCEEGLHTYGIQGVLTTRERFCAIYGNDTHISFDTNISLEYNKEYTVIFDNVKYKCKCKPSQYAIGNEYVANYLLTDTGEPFFIHSYDGSSYTIYTMNPGSHTIAIKEDVYNTIDKKFLPKLIGVPGEGKDSEIFNDYVNNVASGDYSHAEGCNTTASGFVSHAEGYDTTASGFVSHAEGYDTTASGSESHAEGYQTTASGSESHAEGCYTTASGQYSHAEGCYTTAFAHRSHAEGTNNLAMTRYQHVQGKYNKYEEIDKYTIGIGTETIDIPTKEFLSGDSYTINMDTGYITITNPITTNEPVVGKYILLDTAKNGNTDTVYEITSITDTELGIRNHYTYRNDNVNGKYAHIVGNGTAENKRSNAHTLAWDGTAEYQGDVIAYGCESGEEPISLKAVSEKVNDISWNTLEDKPFGETYVEITPETSFVIESQLVSTDNALIGELEVGKTYEITWDGVVYNCECKVITQTDPDLGLTMAQKYLGNLKYSEIEGYEEDTGEPFFIIYESTSDKYYAVKTGSRRGTHTIAIKGLFETSTVNMASGDSMRGPGVGASFTVGETYKVTWDGVVYNCECKYYEYNQYNKYHYVGNLSLRFDNQEDTGEPFLMYYYTNIGNNPHVTSLSGEHTVEIENLVPERTIKINSSSIETLSIPLPFTFNTELVEGQNYKVVLNDKTYICECKTIMGEIPYIGNLSLMKDIILGTGEPFLIIIEPNMGPMYLYDLPGEFTIIVYGEGVKQLDPKFLPEHSWNTLEDKPFGTFRGVIAEGHDVPAMMIGMVSEFPMLSFDKTYTFNFNGVDYQGVLKILPDMTPVEGSTMGCYIGNITLLTGTMGGMADSLLGDAADDIVDTGEPFFIMDMGDNMAIACWAANELNMTISDGENIVIENVSVTAMMEGAACIIPVNYPISEGGLYEITIDDMNVIGECKNRNGTLYVGNVFLSTGKEEENTGESFYFEYSDETEPTTGIRVRILRGIFPEGKIISIVKFIGDYNKQIDSKYLDLDLSSKPGELGTGIYSEIFNDYTGNIASGEYSHAEGSGTDALGDYSHAEGIGSIASGEYSHAEGYYTEATGSRSHAEGSMTLASGHMGAHAEGHSTVASGRCSHSEGQATLASEEYAHAEGTWTVAAGIASHAEGVGYVGNSGRYIKISAEANSTTLTINDDLDASYKHLLIHSEIGNSNITDCKVVNGKVVEITVDNPLSTKTLTNSSEQLSLKNIATGEASHVEGKRTLALSDYQHVQGKYNALDTDDKYAHIVGNGANDDNRSNAHTLDWSGNAEFQGDVIAYGCGGESPISLKALLDRIVSLETELAELKASALTTITDDGEGNVTIE